VLQNLRINLTPEQNILECRGCKYFNPKTKAFCNRQDKRETGKEGKCLNKKKVKAW
jgi:hypothetical protein